MALRILFTGEMTIRIMAMGLSTYLFGKGRTGLTRKKLLLESIVKL